MAETAPAEMRPARGWTPAILRVLGVVGLGLGVMLAIALLLLDSPLGHRLVTDRIAALRLQSGLIITIGRIDGSLLGTSSLHDVVLSDASGRFLTLPEADLAWRPLPALRLVAGFGGGLDIRDLTLHRGLLLRAPHLNASDPNAPILPDFDIRIDRFRVEGLTVAPGLAGARRRIDLTAQADVRHGRVLLSCTGRLGGRDHLSLHLDSEPDRDRFALDLDYRAPADGLLAGLTAGATGGVRHGIVAQVGGAGRFSQWHGWLLASADGHRLAGGLIDNAAGQYRLAALVHPGAVASGLPADFAARPLAVSYAGTFAGARLDGRYHLGDALGRIDGQGAIDLANNRAQALALTARLLKPELLPAAWTTIVQPGAAVMTAQLDGPFNDLAIRHDLALTQLAVGSRRATGLHTTGVARWHNARLDVPLAASAVRIDTGTPWLDPHLAGARLTGTVSFGGHMVSGNALHVIGNGVSGDLSLKGDLRSNIYALAGRVDTRGFAVPRMGLADGTGKGVLVLAQGHPWTLAVNYAANVSHFAMGGLTSLVGPTAHVAGSAHWGGALGGGAVALTTPDMRVTSPLVAMTARVSYAPGGRIEVTTQGTHTGYGAFDAHALIDHGATTAEAHFAEPLPSAGVKAVKVAVASTAGGYHLNLTGDSRLGPVVLALDFAVPANAGPNDPIRMTLADARVFNTNLTGTLAFDTNGLDGDLLMTGGGLDGTIHFGGQAGGQAIEAAINAHAAKFGGDKPISVAIARLTASALISPGNTTLNSALQAQGVAIGQVFIGRLIAEATVVNGAGSVTASLAGRRGTRFALQGTAAFAPDRVIAFVAGDYAGNAITMPRRAILTREGDGWTLSPTQVDFGSGAIIANGKIGAGSAAGETNMHVAISRMPLSALDIIYADLGLGGYVSGVVDFRNDHTGAPAGHAALSVRGLSRSGLVLTSRPLDLALVGQLDERAVQVRAVAREGKVPRMRLEAVVADLPRGGTMIERVRGGRLNGQMRYAGPADALWRLAAIDAFDLTGPIGIAAQVSGTIDTPVLTGAVVSHAMRAQSSISGSDIQNIDVAGSFSGAHLSLAHFTGTTAGNNKTGGGKTAGGKIAGSGSIDFSDASSEHPKIDLRIGATNAELVNRPEMAATITGPMRIVSDGTSGTIAGRLKVDRARYVMGRTTAAQALPTIAVSERNAPADVAPPATRGPPWKLLIDAAGANRLDVHGMGLQSEWQTDVRIRGDTANPQIFGSADVIQGSYEFSGKRFDLTRGRIRFNGETPIDPQLDIVATGDANDISATINIAGSATHPQITFASTPVLPEEELLSRILFGSSISQISAPEAVQLASALASLRGGGGLDPINKLRGAIGLDRLRVLSADPTIPRGTSIAVGKYLGRKFYIELVTDGHGYSATSIEFRLTRWLSLLGTISTVYDESASLKFMKDY